MAKSNFGHVQRVTKEVGGKVCTFRSLLEYRWAVWCQLRKEQGIIIDWWFEDQPIVIETMYLNNKKLYLPDFSMLMPNGDYEFEETKGWFPQKDYTKMKLAAQQYENPITLIFANLTNCKSTRAQYNRAKRLEPFLKRIIYEANKTIFKPIKHLFEN